MKSRLDATAAQLQILGMDTRHLQAQGIHPYLEIKAPLSGYVTNMNVNLGNILMWVNLYVMSLTNRR